MDHVKSGLGSSGSDLPPGFRFHPTDEELIMYYLRNRVTARPCPVSIITEVDIYKFDPWQLPEKAKFGEREWYFFSQRDRKYPNGARPNRAATSGYWKATGTDKSICSGSTNVGVKKALVFYEGRPPKGAKTDWIMHEYRLCDSKRRDKMLNGSMKLDDWVLCRIYKKRHLKRIVEQKQECSYSQGSVTTVIESDRTSNLPRPTSFLNLLEFDHQAVSWLLTGNPIDSDFQTYDNNHDIVCGDMDDSQLSSIPCQLLNASLC